MKNLFILHVKCLFVFHSFFNHSLIYKLYFQKDVSQTQFVDSLFPLIFCILYIVYSSCAEKWRKVRSKTIWLLALSNSTDIMSPLGLFIVSFLCRVGKFSFSYVCFICIFQHFPALLTCFGWSVREKMEKHVWTNCFKFSLFLSQKNSRNFRQ